MGSNSKTPGRLGLRSMLGASKGDQGPESSAAIAASAKADATVDIGALMRKKRLLVGTSGIGGGSGLPSSRGAAAPATAHFAAGLGLDVSVENPAAEAGQRLSDEDSGELAALAALQRRRRSVAPGSAQKRYGSWFEGDDRELEHTLHEYNRAAPASPRMTRSQRRKSLAQGKRAAGARRKSMAALSLRCSQPLAAPCLQAIAPPVAEAVPAEGDSVAAEVAALNAELCAELDGMIEESPEKKGRGDGQSLRDKLLQSWDGRTYYVEAAADVAGRGARQANRQGGAASPSAAAKAVQQQQPGAARQPAAAQFPAAAAEQTAKPTSRTPAPAKPAAPLPSQPAPRGQPTCKWQAWPWAAAAGAGPPRQRCSHPNSQRRKLNELTTSLQLLKVTSRHRSQPAAAAAAPAGGGASAQPPPRVRLNPVVQATKAAPTAGSKVAAAGSQTPGRSRSASPETEEPHAAAASKTGGRRRSRRGTTPPTEASVAPSTRAAGQAAPRRGRAGSGGSGRCDARRGGCRLRDAQCCAERQGQAGRKAEEDGAELAQRGRSGWRRRRRAARLRQELEQARRERTEEAAAVKSGRQQLARELAEAQAAAAATAERAGEAEALAQRCAEAEKALSAILRAANSGLKAAAAGREEAKALADALRGGEENAGAVPALSTGAGGRQLRQSAAGGSGAEGDARAALARARPYHSALRAQLGGP
ncbi:hypothetical protein ABPG77_006596 [Micractinium sp. CCAP 211/92]